jgi:hypothetical protein
MLTREDFPMKSRNLILGAILSVGLFASGIVVGQNVSGARHPNLNAAQRLMEQATGKMDAAQQANEFDMHGHAQKAKDLLAQAYSEVKQAAEAANHH